MILEGTINAEEKITAFMKAWEAFWPGALEFLINLVIGILILVIGKLVIRLIMKAIRRLLSKTKADAGVQGFALSIIKVLLYIVLMIVIAGILGIPTASLITLLGSAGLAIGLALQGSLANFAGGVLILILQPFRVGDYIETGNGTGTVSSIDIFYTKLLTPDGRAIVIPNGALSNGSITNYSREKLRRIDLVIPIGYGDDIRKAKTVLEQVALEQGERLAQQSVDIFVTNFGDDAVELAFRLWVKNEDYWPVRGDVLERVKVSFDENGISIPFRQMDVTIVNQPEVK